MSHKNQIPWHNPEHSGVEYYLAKGKGTKPEAWGTCLIHKEEEAGLTNSFVLEHKDFVQRPRVQSRFRVSPSPRKVPRYKIDEMASGLMNKMSPFRMVRNF